MSYATKFLETFKILINGPQYLVYCLVADFKKKMKLNYGGQTSTTTL